MSLQNMPPPLIVALDYASQLEALSMADELDPKQCRVKVGKELFTRCGPSVVSALHQKGFQVFLDLKFHDIPNTVAKAVLAAAELGVWMVNVHASGGSRMMQAAKDILLENQRDSMHLIAVTLLTSMSESDLIELGIQLSPQDQVLRLAQLAKHSGAGGVVCSAQEAPLLKKELGQDFKLVCPGIRPASSSQTDDQRRTMTPSEAIAAGADYIVVGRPITQAADPMSVVASILAEIPQLA